MPLGRTRAPQWACLRYAVTQGQARTHDARAIGRQAHARRERAGAQRQVAQREHAAPEHALQQRARAANAAQRRLLARRQRLHVHLVVVLSGPRAARQGRAQALRCLQPGNIQTPQRAVLPT